MSFGRRHPWAAAFAFYALMLAARPAAATPAAPASRAAPPPSPSARAAAVMEFARGELIYARDADSAISPASLTKVMTMHLALKAVESGRIGLDQVFEIERRDVTLPYGSSLMYLRAGMRVPFRDLVLGMAVMSGNDAALAAARLIAGSVSDFAALMNEEAAALGLAATRFAEPTGLSHENLSSARDMATLAREYILTHPGVLAEYHARTSMEFPRAEVMPPGEPAPAGRILLRNRNGLIFNYPGADGLKTGFIRETGSHLIATAEREGTRFVVVLLGGSQGGPALQREARAMLNWAFDNYKTITPPLPELPSPRLWGGRDERLRLAIEGGGPVTVPKPADGELMARLSLPEELEAPIARGTRVGELSFLRDGEIVLRLPVVAAEDGELGSPWTRLRDWFARLFARVFRAQA